VLQRRRWARFAPGARSAWSVPGIRCKELTRASQLDWPEWMSNVNLKAGYDTGGLSLSSDPRFAAASPCQTTVARDNGAKVAFGMLCIFTFALFARPEDLLPTLGALHLMLVCATCASVAYLGALMLGHTRVRWSTELSIVLCLTAWFALGVPFAFWRGGSFTVLSQTWLRTVLIFFLLTQTLVTVSRIRKIIWAVLLSELIVSCASIMQQANPELREGGRLSGVNMVFLGWNYFGITVSLTLPFLAFVYVSSRRSFLRTSLLLAIAGSTVWMLLLTASRGGFLNMIVSMILTWWLLLRRSLRGRVVGVLCAICLAIAVATAPDVFWLRFRTIWDDSSSAVNQTAASAEESAKGRGFLLAQSIKYSLHNPIFGVGLGNFPEYNAAQLHRSDAWFETHNTFTELSSEAGIPALALFLALLFTLLRKMKVLIVKLSADPANEELCLLVKAALVSTLSFAFSGFFAHLAYEYLFYYVAGIAVALGTIAVRTVPIKQGHIEPIARFESVALARIPKCR
jgi:O-antigen ligase